MLSVPQRHRIFLAVKPIDFPKGIDGIALLCKNQFSQDPMSGHYFVFHNKRKTDLKILEGHFHALLLLLLLLGVDPRSGLGLADAASLEQSCSRIQWFLRPLHVQQAVGFML